MTSSWAEIGTIVAIIASVTAVVLSLLRAPGEVKQLGAQAAGAKIDTITRYEQQVAKYVEKVDQLQTKVDQLEEAARLRNIEYTTQLGAQAAEIKELRAGVVLLIAQLEARGDVPVWKPKDKPNAKQ